jgi:CspA family cold shock protein
MANPELVSGTVKWFNAEKGFGFISTADHGDVFVHVRALAEGQATLAVGELVHFNLRQAEKGPEAANVRAGVPPPPPKPALPTVDLPTPAVPSHVNMRIVGRPAGVRWLGWPEQPPSLVACVFELGGEAAPAVPSGLPLPSAATACLILIAAKHWRQVASALEADPEDTLVIDGTAGIDPLAPGMITLRATSVTTTATLQAKWAAQALARAASVAEADAALDSGPGDSADVGNSGDYKAPNNPSIDGQ